MRLAILDAVPTEFYMSDDVIRDTDHFIRLLNAVEFAGEIVSYHVGGGEFPADVNDADAYLITGSPADAFGDEPWVRQLIDLIVDLEAARIPLVGICFGHQAIAAALGGEVARADFGWQAGLYTFEISDPPVWLSIGGEGEPTTAKLYHLNQDQVLTLPPGATHRGGSATCPNAMFTVGNHVLGIQGHPEMQLASLQGYLANELRDIVPPDKQTYAATSIAQDQPDDLRIGHWIRTFIEMER